MVTTQAPQKKGLLMLRQPGEVALSTHRISPMACENKSLWQSSSSLAFTKILQNVSGHTWCLKTSKLWGSSWNSSQTIHLGDGTVIKNIGISFTHTISMTSKACMQKPLPNRLQQKASAKWVSNLEPKNT
jgi:hypothetical protein